MPRRIDVELTSARDDGSFTWRAAGAKQPKGTVDAGLLYPGAKVGDVVRAEAEFDIEGITITSVLPPKDPKQEPTTLEIRGPRREEPGVTTSLTGRREGERGGRRREGGDERRPAGERRGRGERPPAGERGPRPERRAGAGAPAGGAPRGGPSGGAPRGERSRPPRAAQPAPERARPKRLSPGSKHRDALLDTLEPEQRPVAEQLLRGGIPAVRAAIAEQNKTRAAGAPEIRAEPLLALADELMPRVREADWRDRAEAAAAIVDEVGLRDLRAVVQAADQAARDDEAKALASQLRDALDRRLGQQRDAWIGDITAALDEGKVTRALRLSSRPPDPTTKLPGELLERLTTSANDAMAPGTPNDRWAALLEAVVSSPVRRNVKPIGLPEQPGAALLLLARQSAGRVPALAEMLGVDIPPPPGPRRPPPPPSPGGDPAAREAARGGDAVPAEGVPAGEPAPAEEGRAGEAAPAEAAPAGDPASAGEGAPEGEPVPVAEDAPEGEPVPVTEGAPEGEAADAGGPASGEAPDGPPTS